MKKWILAVLAALVTLGLPAQNRTCPEYEKLVFITEEGDSLNYRLLRPEQEQEGKKYPIFLFLHGAGERGDDNNLQLLFGAQLWLNPVVREKYPAYVLFPQCPQGYRWTNISDGNFTGVVETTPDLRLVLKEFLDYFIAMPQTDDRRVYVSGLSMGGIGTFELCEAYPELFAAALPICGATHMDYLGKAKDVPFRIYHGDDDYVVSFEYSRKAYRKLKELGADVTYIEFPGVNHGCWNLAFADPKYLEWTFHQKKRK